MQSPPGVEDPISAIFDLSDRVAEMAPLVRRMYRYTSIVLLFWIVIMAVVALATLHGAFWLTILAVVGLIIGGLGFSLLRQTDRFFRLFVARHRSIRLVREADPRVKIPDGRTPVERLGRHLIDSNPTVDAFVRLDPSAVRYKVALPGAKRSVPFDLVIERPGGAIWKTLGMGDHGFAILARVGPEAPTVADLQRLEQDVSEVGHTLDALPVRAILLRTQPIPLPEDVYEYSVGHPAYVRRGGESYRVALEIVTEQPDGTYDFVPHVLGVP
ncbi:MAG: hypothetical protein L3K19_06335 [Thermoplasmata archaeon]|nr:hypothetical protein [Thermoplasmata archaeon]